MTSLPLKKLQIELILLKSEIPVSLSNNKKHDHVEINPTSFNSSPTSFKRFLLLAPASCSFGRLKELIKRKYEEMYGMKDSTSIHIPGFLKDSEMCDFSDCYKIEQILDLSEKFIFVECSLVPYEEDSKSCDSSQYFDYSANSMPSAQTATASVEDGLLCATLNAKNSSLTKENEILKISKNKSKKQKLSAAESSTTNNLALISPDVSFSTNNEETSVSKELKKDTKKKKETDQKEHTKLNDSVPSVAQIQSKPEVRIEAINSSANQVLNNSKLKSKSVLVLEKKSKKPLKANDMDSALSDAKCQTPNSLIAETEATTPKIHEKTTDIQADSLNKKSSKVPKGKKAFVIEEEVAPRLNFSNGIADTIHENEGICSRSKQEELDLKDKSASHAINFQPAVDENDKNANTAEIRTVAVECSEISQISEELSKATSDVKDTKSKTSSKYPSIKDIKITKKSSIRTASKAASEALNKNIAELEKSKRILSKKSYSSSEGEEDEKISSNTAPKYTSSLFK